MKTSKYLFTAMTVALLTFAGCGGSSSDSSPAVGDDNSGGGGGSGATQSTFSDDKSAEFLTRIQTVVPGCTVVGSDSAPARSSGALPAVVKKVQFSDSLTLDILETSSQTSECTDKDGTVAGAMTMTGSEDGSEMSIDLQNCNLGSFTQQDTLVNGQLNLAMNQDSVSDDFISISASTGATGVSLIDTDVEQNVKLTMTGTNTLTMGSMTQADPTVIDISHVALIDNVDATQSFVLDDCQATMWEIGGDSYLNLKQCTYTEDGGTFTNSGEFVTNEATGMTSGTMTTTASDGTDMVFTMDDSSGMIDVAVDGQTPVQLDCTAVDTSVVDDLSL